MTTTANSTPRRRTRWSDTLVVAAIAAGAVCSGVGISTAETGSTATDSTTVTAADAAADTYQWTVTNFTDQPLTAGEFHRAQEVSYGYWLTSYTKIGATASQPVLGVGQNVSGYQQFMSSRIDPATKINGKVCYAHNVWTVPEIAMRRTKDPRGLDWDHLYIFAMDDGHGGKKLMVTPEHAHDDVDMTTTGESC